MIRNLLYSLSLHLVIALIVYLNFRFQDFVEFESIQPITVSFVALKEEESLTHGDEKKDIKEEEVDINKKKIDPPKKKPEKKTKKKPKKKTKSKVTKSNKENKDKKRAIEASKESANVEKTHTINLSARERFNVQLQIKNCYKKAVQETSSYSDIPIKVKVKLRPNGTINLFSLEVLNKIDFKNYPNDYNAALNNAKIALDICSPVRNLPKDKYEIWQEIELTFDYKE